MHCGRRRRARASASRPLPASAQAIKGPGKLNRAPTSYRLFGEQENIQHKARAVNLYGTKRWWHGHAEDRIQVVSGHLKQRGISAGPVSPLQATTGMPGSMARRRGHTAMTLISGRRNRAILYQDQHRPPAHRAGCPSPHGKDSQDRPPLSRSTKQPGSSGLRKPGSNQAHRKSHMDTSYRRGQARPQPPAWMHGGAAADRAIGSAGNGRRTHVCAGPVELVKRAANHDRRGRAR
jgi:hypothetical protein